MINFLSSLYILEIRPLSDVGLVKIFSHSVGCHFVLLTVSFALQKLLSFRRSHLFIDSLIVCATGVLPRKWSPVPMSYRLLPTFSSIRFNVVRLMLRSLIHLDLSFVHGDRYGSIFILLHVDIQLCQHHLLNMLSFFYLVFFVSLSNISCSKVCVFIFGSLIQFHWSSCQFLCQYQAVFSRVAL